MALLTIHSLHEAMVFEYKPPHSVPWIGRAGDGAVGLSSEITRDVYLSGLAESFGAGVVAIVADHQMYVQKFKHQPEDQDSVVH